MSRLLNDAFDRNAFEQPDPQPPGCARVSNRHRVRARDPVAGAEGAAQDVVAVHQRRELAHLVWLQPAGVGDASPVPHRQQAPEVRDLAVARQHEQVADVPELRIDARLRLETGQQLHRELLHDDVCGGGELTPDPASASARRLRSERLSFHKHDLRASPREVVCDGAPDHPATHDHGVSRAPDHDRNYTLLGDGVWRRSGPWAATLWTI